MPCHDLAKTGLRHRIVTTRVGQHGADVRLFNIWPRLFRHHNEFGDGRRLCFDREFGLTLIP